MLADIWELGILVSNSELVPITSFNIDKGDENKVDYVF